MEPYQTGKEGNIDEEYEGLPVSFKTNSIGRTIYSATTHAYYSLKNSSIYSFRSDDSENFPKYWEIDFHRIIYNVNCFQFTLTNNVFTSNGNGHLYYNYYAIGEYKIFYSIDDEEFIEFYHEINENPKVYEYKTINFEPINIRSIRFVVYSIVIQHLIHTKLQVEDLNCEMLKYHN